MIQAITGVVGSGKSTLLAEMVNRAKKTYPNALIIARYIGVTPETSDLGELLNGIHKEITRGYSDTEPNWIKDENDLILTVAHDLATVEVSQERPLLVFVDALDQLSNINTRIDWIPGQLSANVRIILSAISDRFVALAGKAAAFITSAQYRS